MEKVGNYTVKTNEGIRVQEAQFCLLCGSEGALLYQNQQDRLFGAPGTWSFMRCPKCGLIWLNPRPVPEDIGKLYETYFTHRTNDHVPKLARLRRVIRNSILATQLDYTELADGPSQKMLGRVLSWVGPIKEMVELSVMTLNGQRRGKFLDVGCGSGTFLAKMRELGWEVIGVEPDSQAVKVAREHFGLNVYEGTLEEAGFSENEFDAITMNHVIEHVPDPISTLRECQRVLKKGGKIVVVTPNIESLGRRLLDKAWFHWDPPRHLFLFSPRTLQMCAERAGLHVQQVRTVARRARYVWYKSRLIQRVGVLPSESLQQVPLASKLERMIFWTIEFMLTKVRPWGEDIILEVRK